MEDEKVVQYQTVREFVDFLKSLDQNSAVQVGEVVSQLENVLENQNKNGTRRRGQLLGLTLDEMNIDQLKRERVNAKSVLYKAQKRGASADTIAANQARVDAVVQRIKDLTGTAESDDAVATETTVDEAVEAEI